MRLKMITSTSSSTHKTYTHVTRRLSPDLCNLQKYYEQKTPADVLRNKPLYKVALLLESRLIIEDGRRVCIVIESRSRRYHPESVKDIMLQLAAFSKIYFVHSIPRRCVRPYGYVPIIWWSTCRRASSDRPIEKIPSRSPWRPEGWIRRPDQD